MAVLAAQLVDAKTTGDLRAFLDVVQALGMDSGEHPITISTQGTVEAYIEVDQLPEPIGGTEGDS